MNKMSRLLLATITLLPCAWASAQQVNRSGQNLHGTVTHINKPFGKVGSKQEQDLAVANPNQPQEKIMPQGDKDFGIYAARVTLFKQFLEQELPQADKRGLIHGVPLRTYDYHQWTQDDLRTLATCFNSYEQFQSLIYMKNSAGAKDANGQYTEEALQAQNALTELKPDDCKNWKSFFNMIVRVEKDTQPERATLKVRKDETRERINRGSGGLIDLNKNDDIAGDPMNNPAFDQQAALIQLEKAGVTKDASDNLKKPLETAVTEAIKGIKSSIILAA